MRKIKNKQLKEQGTPGESREGKTLKRIFLSLFPEIFALAEMI